MTLLVKLIDKLHAEIKNNTEINLEEHSIYTEEDLVSFALAFLLANLDSAFEL